MVPFHSSCPPLQALCSAWMSICQSNLRKRSKVVAGRHIFSWNFCMRLLLHTASWEKKECLSLGSEVWQWSSVIGFQDNKAVFQISICISAFSACAPVSAYALEKNDGRNFRDVICEKCLLSQGTSVSNNQPFSPSNRWLWACSFASVSKRAMSCRYLQSAVLEFSFTEAAFSNR